MQIAMGVPVKWAKLEWGSRPKWLGYQLNLVNFTVTVASDKLEQIRMILRDVFTTGWATLRQLDTLVGKLVRCSICIPCARPFLRSGYALKSRLKSKNHSTEISGVLSTRHTVLVRDCTSGRRPRVPTSQTTRQVGMDHGRIFNAFGWVVVTVGPSAVEGFEMHGRAMVFPPHL